MGCELAKRDGAALHMISVEELPDFPASIDEIVEIKDAENRKYHDVLETCARDRQGKQYRS